MASFINNLNNQLTIYTPIIYHNTRELYLRILKRTNDPYNVVNPHYFEETRNHYTELKFPKGLQKIETNLSYSLNEHPDVFHRSTTMYYNFSPGHIKELIKDPIIHHLPTFIDTFF